MNLNALNSVPGLMVPGYATPGSPGTPQQTAQQATVSITATLAATVTIEADL